MEQFQVVAGSVLGEVKTAINGYLKIATEHPVDDPEMKLRELSRALNVVLEKTEHLAYLVSTQPSECAACARISIENGLVGRGESLPELDTIADSGVANGFNVEIYKLVEYSTLLMAAYTAGGLTQELSALIDEHGKGSYYNDATRINMLLTRTTSALTPMLGAIALVKF